MKKLGIICLIFFAGSAFAQQRITGPEAKNTNVWELKKNCYNANYERCYNSFIKISRT